MSRSEPEPYTLKMATEEFEMAILKRRKDKDSFTDIDRKIIARRVERAAFKVARSFMLQNDIPNDNYRKFSIHDKRLQTTALLIAHVGESFGPLLQQAGVTVDFEPVSDRLTSIIEKAREEKYRDTFPGNIPPADWRKLDPKLTEHIGEAAARGLRQKLQDAAVIGLYESSPDSWSPWWRRDKSRSDAYGLSLFTALMLGDRDLLPAPVRKLAEAALAPSLTQENWPPVVAQYEKDTEAIRLAHQIKCNPYYLARELFDGKYSTESWLGAGRLIEQIAGNTAVRITVQELQFYAIEKLAQAPPQERAGHDDWQRLKILVGTDMHPEVARIERENDFSGAALFCARVALGVEKLKDQSNIGRPTFVVSHELPPLLAESTGPRTSEAVAKLFQYRHRPDSVSWSEITASPHLPAVIDGMFERAGVSISSKPATANPLDLFDLRDQWKSLLATADSTEKIPGPERQLPGVERNPAQSDRVQILRHLDRRTAGNPSFLDWCLLNHIAGKFFIGATTPLEVRRLLGEWARAEKVPGANALIAERLDDMGGIRATDDRRNGSRVRLAKEALRTSGGPQTDLEQNPPSK